MLLVAHSFESFLKGANEVLNIAHHLILLLESIVHFLLNVCPVFLELTHGVSLEAVHPLILSLDLTGDSLV